MPIHGIKAYDYAKIRAVKVVKVYERQATKIRIFPQLEKEKASDGKA